jgi:hypothetical protein
MTTPDQHLPQRDREPELSAALDSINLQPIQRAYLHERWLGQLRYLGQNARRAQWRYYALRLVAILGGVTIPALIGLNFNDDWDAVVQWLAFVLGLLVAAAVALEEFFRFGDRWRHFRQQSELLRGEGWAYLQLAGPAYRRYDGHAEAFQAFVGRVEEIIRQEVGIYIAEVARAPEVPTGSRNQRPQDSPSRLGTVPGGRTGASSTGDSPDEP